MPPVEPPVHVGGILRGELPRVPHIRRHLSVVQLVAVRASQHQRILGIVCESFHTHDEDDAIFLVVAGVCPEWISRSDINLISTEVVRLEVEIFRGRSSCVDCRHKEVDIATS